MYTDTREIKLPQFRNSELWQKALTHRSYFNEHPEVGEDNERLEFLGDAVLGFLVGNLLYERYPQMQEGQLSSLRSALVNNERQLAEFALQLGIDRAVRLGRGAEQEGSSQNPDLLSDTFEAIIGAYFLDSGIEAVREFVEPLFTTVADKFASQSLSKINFKGQFQEWALANTGKNPQYSIIDESGQDHAKVFTAEVCLGERQYGVGKGNSKKTAEKRAAEAALKFVSRGG